MVGIWVQRHLSLVSMPWHSAASENQVGTHARTQYAHTHTHALSLSLLSSLFSLFPLCLSLSLSLCVCVSLSRVIRRDIPTPVTTPRPSRQSLEQGRQDETKLSSRLETRGKKQQKKVFLAIVCTKHLLGCTSPSAR
ncbi:hypothetical protein BD289DRAFT_134309 [Coniella lustricola]|uniref:Uncharacterized protein n=1 Tax=Coniella lustricola TaxID=2025994 RepID=A0A2T2ZVS2_9PEZI|nr:hypothetical protein BD289DRAFT_134309 [Coniella lustricola]